MNFYEHNWRYAVPAEEPYSQWTNTSVTCPSLVITLTIYLSTLELFDVFFPLPRCQGQRYNTADVHIGTINMHIKLQLLANGLDVFETLLIIGSRSTNPDLNFVLDERAGDLSQCANDAFKCRCNLGYR